MMAMKWPEIEYVEAPDGMLDPVLEFPKQPGGSVGKYGGMRLDYLQQHRKAAYGRMRLEGTLKQHLMDANEEANRMVDQLIEKMLKTDPAPDKAKNQMGWVRHMNSLKAQAEEIVRSELIYV
ncbi:MAG: TnpV protein [Clostridia bacterium]